MPNNIRIYNKIIASIFQFSIILFFVAVSLRLGEVGYYTFKVSIIASLAISVLVQIINYKRYFWLIVGAWSEKRRDMDSFIMIAVLYPVLLMFIVLGCYVSIVEGESIISNAFYIGKFKNLFYLYCTINVVCLLFAFIIFDILYIFGVAERQS